MSEVSINIFKYEGDFRVSVNNDTPVRFIPPETYIRDYLREKDLSGEKAVRIGNELFERVFNTKERAERFKELIKNLSSMDRLTISIISDDSFIHEIPWEVLNIDRKSFLLKSVNISILRSTANSVSFSRSLNLPFKILIALSLPVETYRKSPLDALREIDIIYKALGELLGDGTAEIDVLENTNVKTIRERLTKDRYDILHLIGHGNIGGSLVFEDSNDYTKEYKVTNDDIEKIFRNTPLQCVVLNACHTASSHISPSTALVINKMGIPLVIANQSSIRDDEAIALSRGIYQGLLKRDPVENLLNTSRINIGTDWWKPVIFTPLRERSLPVSVRLAESAAKKRGFISIGSININSVSAFVYRFEPVRRLGNLLSGEGRVMVMHGIGGAGKSVLASYAAKFYKERFDIVIFMNIGDIKTPGELIDTAAERLMRDRFIGEDEIAGIKKEKDPVLKWRRLYKSLNNALLFLILDNLETAQYRDGKIKEGDGWHDFIMGLIDEGGFRGKLLITTRIIPVKDNIRWTREENIIEIGEYEDNEFILYLEMISKEMGLILPGNFRGLIGHTGKHPLGVYTALRLLKEMGQSGFEIKDIINEISDRLRFYDGYLHIKSFIPPYPLSAGFMKRLSGSESFRLMNESLRIFKREGLNGVNYLTPY
ncbi:MAG: CHAT domain-containing protein, partial [Nitrospinae bacterium]|nr:CHAT domain-containing protein [Nitrospinota bacterium]